jgi:Domain of unknown function (DUF4124)
MRLAAAPLVTALLIALACGSAAAQWKWRDANGRISASDLPPPATVPERDVLERPTDPRRIAGVPRTAASAASGAASAPRTLTAPITDPELDARRKRAADEQVAQQRQQQERDAAVRTENCSRARGHLAALADGQRMTRTNALGEREVLDDKGRADEMQRARAVIASDCR